MASLRISVEHLIRNIDESVLARVRRYRGKSSLTDAMKDKGIHHVTVPRYRVHRPQAANSRTN